MSAGASITEHRLVATDSTVHVSFWDNSLKPVLTINSGDIVSFETRTLMNGQLKPGMAPEGIIEARYRFARKRLSVHALTGPVYVNGAEPGDVLEVQILRLVLKPYAHYWILPGRFGYGPLPEDFPDEYARSFQWEKGASDVDFGHGIRIPLRPFLGNMGVAPATPGPVTMTKPGPHGGNMDIKELGEGSKLYLPVFVPGALFSTGDAHAAQGDGEAGYAALEGSMRDARLRFVVRKDMKLERPIAETPTHWITMGFHPDLDQAAKMALRDTIRWLMQNKGLSHEEAYSLCSFVVDLRVSQLVNDDKGIHAMIPKEVFEG